MMGIPIEGWVIGGIAMILLLVRQLRSKPQLATTSAKKKVSEDVPSETKASKMWRGMNVHTLLLGVAGIIALAAFIGGVMYLIRENPQLLSADIDFVSGMILLISIVLITVGVWRLVQKSSGGGMLIVVGLSLLLFGSANLTMSVRNIGENFVEWTEPSGRPKTIGTVHLAIGRNEVWLADSWRHVGIPGGTCVIRDPKHVLEERFSGTEEISTSMEARSRTGDLVKVTFTVYDEHDQACKT